MVEALLLPEGIYKRNDGRWCRTCPECGMEQDHLRRNYCVNAHMVNKLCIKCSNEKNGNGRMGWHRGVRMSWYRKFEVSAQLRGLTWAITIDDVADLMDEQEGCCALTGWPIVFPESGHSQDADASIDRIDNAFGYMRENIQLVHKHVNMMKSRYDNDYFVAVCQAVTEHNREKW